MEVILPAELQAKLARVALEQGRDPQELAREAIERLVDYDQWFVGEVEKGLAQIDSGETLTHAEVRGRIDRLLESRRSSR